MRRAAIHSRTDGSQRATIINVEENSMKKRLLATLLTLCLIAGLLPASVLAAPSGQDPASAACICTEACAEDAINTDCPVCRAEPTGCSHRTVGSGTAVLDAGASGGLVEPEVTFTV